MMIPWAVISSTWASVFSLASIGILHLCCTGGMMGSNVMVYGAGILPILSKESGKV